MDDEYEVLESRHRRLADRPAPWQATTALDGEFRLLAGLGLDRELCYELAIDPNELYQDSSRSILDAIVTLHCTARHVSKNALRIELERSGAFSGSLDDALQAVAYFMLHDPPNAEQTRLAAGQVRRHAWLRQQWVLAATRAEEAWTGRLGDESSRHEVKHQAAQELQPST